MIDGKWLVPGSDISAALEIRKSVFGIGADPLDSESWNVIARMDEVPVAAGRIRWFEDAFWLEHIGVLPEWRGKRMGDLILRLLLFKAQTHAARKVCVVCPPEVSGFFTRLGFREESRNGNALLLGINGEDIDLDTCKGCLKKDCPNRK